MEYGDHIRMRLRRIEGQIRGVLRMMEEGKDCKDVVVQMSAIRSAVDRAIAVIVCDNLEVLSPGGDRQGRIGRYQEAGPGSRRFVGEEPLTRLRDGLTQGDSRDRAGETMNRRTRFWVRRLLMLAMLVLIGFALFRRGRMKGKRWRPGRRPRILN